MSFYIDYGTHREESNKSVTLDLIPKMYDLACVNIDINEAHDEYIFSKGFKNIFLLNKKCQIYTSWILICHLFYMFFMTIFCSRVKCNKKNFNFRV